MEIRLGIFYERASQSWHVIILQAVACLLLAHNIFYEPLDLFHCTADLSSVLAARFISYAIQTV